MAQNCNKKKNKKNKKNKNNNNENLNGQNKQAVEKNTINNKNDIPNDKFSDIDVHGYSEALKQILVRCKMVCIISPNALTYYSNPLYREVVEPKMKNLDSSTKQEASKFMFEFNTENSSYWSNHDITGVYDMVGMYYNKQNRRKGKAVYPYSLSELFQLYKKFKVEAEVYLMKTSICCYSLKKNINELINSIIQRIPLGKLKENIEIPLTIPNLDRYTCFLMVVASNGIISIGHPFTLRFQECHSNEDHKLKLSKDLPFSDAVLLYCLLNNLFI